MNLARKLFGHMRWYRALAWSYEEMTRMDRLNSAGEQIRTIGPNSVIHPRVAVTHPGRVHIGDWTTIYSDCLINSQGGVHIGDYVGIGYGVTILSFNHNYRNAESIPFDTKCFLQPVFLRDFVWIGFRCCILPGIEIGEGAIVGMGSVVTKNVPPLAIVQGNPATVVGRRSQEHFDRCRAEGRVMPHRIKRGTTVEEIPLMTRRRFAKELRELGLMEPEDPSSKP